MSVSTEPIKILCKDLFKFGSQKGKVMDRKGFGIKTKRFEKVNFQHK